jgi:SAM-dependent methyltransferase
MTERSREGWEVFDGDARARGQYTYTAGLTLSSRLATDRSLSAILASGRLANRSVLDVGCGDGHFAARLYEVGRPRTWTGIDRAEAAIEVARARTRNTSICFEVGDSHRLPFERDSFDIALLQSLLHHDDAPEATLAEAFRVAPEILIHEPNGNNPGVKLIERVSPYHIEHNEKSYTSTRLRSWIASAGGEVLSVRYAGFVPMFCSDRVARIMKMLEPAVEATPIMRGFSCAVVVIVARRAEQRELAKPLS